MTPQEALAAALEPLLVTWPTAFSSRDKARDLRDRLAHADAILNGLSADGWAVTREPIIGNCPECDAPIGNGLGCDHWPAQANALETAPDHSLDAQTEVLLAALAERGIYSAGDLEGSDRYDLGAAWRAAEEAAAGVGIVALRHHVGMPGDYRATWFRPVDPTGGGTVIAESGDSPAEALLALAAKLRERVS